MALFLLSLPFCIADVASLRHHSRHCEDTPVHKFRKALVLPKVQRARIMSDAFWAAVYAISTQGVAQVRVAVLDVVASP
jgi:hypothetical protein